MSNSKQPLPQWLWWVTLGLILFLPISPFLVTVTHWRFLSGIRELITLVMIGYGVWHRRRFKLPFIADDPERIIAWLLALSLISLAFITHDFGAWAWSARYSLLPLAVFWGLHPFKISEEQWYKLGVIWLSWSSLLIVFGILMVTVIPHATLIKWGYSDTVAIGGGQWVGSAALPAYQAVAGGIPRLQATLTGPIQLAGFAVLLLFVGGTVALKQKRFTGVNVALTLAGIAILGTFSRSMWLALALMLVALGLRALRQRGWSRKEISMMIVIVVVGVYAVGGLFLFRPNAESLRYTVGSVFAHEGSDQQHAESISQSLADWRQVGFFGLGFGRSGAGAIQNAANNPLAPLPRYVDNSYLRWWEELGWPGGILFICLLVIVIGELRRLPSPARNLALAGIALALAAILTDMWLEAVPVVTFFALAGLLHERPAPAPETVLFPWFSLDPRPLAAIRAELASWATGSTPHTVVTLNPEMFVAATQDDAVRAAIRSADLITPDGAGILAAADVLRQLGALPWWLRPVWLPFAWVVSGLKLVFTPGRLRPRLTRVTGSDLVSGLLDEANTKKQKVALLGSTPAVIDQAKLRMKEHWPGATLVVAEPGPEFTDQTIPSPVAKRMVEGIAHIKPQYLFVAFGVPRQELFLNEWKTTLNVPVMIGVSGAFDSVLAQTVRRAPRFLQALHLEWLWRLILNPRRFNRILTAVWRFPVAFSRQLLRDQ